MGSKLLDLNLVNFCKINGKSNGNNIEKNKWM